VSSTVIAGGKQQAPADLGYLTYARVSTRVSRMLPILLVSCPCSLNAASITEISVAVVSIPVKAHQSLTTIPAPITSDPRFTVPAWLGW
jgi:hypothetical protein